MSGDIEVSKCSFCKQIKPVQRLYIRVEDKECDSIIIWYCKDHEPDQEAKYKALAKVSDMQEKEIRGLKIEAMDYKDTNMHLGEECDMQIEKIQELKEVLTKVFYQTNYCPDEDYLKIEKLINKDNNIRKTLNKH